MIEDKKYQNDKLVQDINKAWKILGGWTKEDQIAYEEYKRMGGK